jgi:hypothetical protein
VRQSLPECSWCREPPEYAGDAPLHLLERCGRIDQLDSPGLTARQREIPCTHSLEEVDRLGLESICTPSVSRARAGKAGGDG